MTLAGILHPDFPALSAGLVGRRATAPWVGQLARFGMVGGGASVLQLATYAFLADSVGSQPANVMSWLVSTLVATEWHRRFSFGGSGSGIEGDHAVGFLTSLLTLLLGAAALATLNDPSDTAGVVALVAVNALVGGLRFVVLRWWMVGRAARRSGPPAPEACPDQSSRPARSGRVDERRRGGAARARGSGASRSLVIESVGRPGGRPYRTADTDAPVGTIRQTPVTTRRLIRRHDVR